IDDPVNPFTGSAINSEYKYNNDDLLIFDSDVFSINQNNGNTFVPGPWYTVHDDMRVIDNWEYVGTW
ncbi:MAG: hypothetical protein IKT14_02320, partial [Clostridiales bacterium]|nr:hypothetical protein [Clostridiales bacterium]